MLDQMRCAECGCEITEDCIGILEGCAGDVEGPLCEGCAEDTLDAIRSSDADARESGLDFADEYPEPLEARDVYDCEYDY